MPRKTLFHGARRTELLAVLIGLLAAPLATAEAQAVAVAYGTPSYFKIWVEYCEVSKDGGLTWVTSGTLLSPWTSRASRQARGSETSCRTSQSLRVSTTGSLQAGSECGIQRADHLQRHTYYTTANFLAPAKTTPPAEITNAVFALLQTVRTQTITLQWWRRKP